MVWSNRSFCENFAHKIFKVLRPSARASLDSSHRDWVSFGSAAAAVAGGVGDATQRTITWESRECPCAVRWRAIGRNSRAKFELPNRAMTSPRPRRAHHLVTPTPGRPALLTSLTWARDALLKLFILCTPSLQAQASHCLSLAKMVKFKFCDSNYY
jgi:hypothetical protein